MTGTDSVVGLDSGVGDPLAAAAAMQGLGEALAADLPGLLADVHAAEKWGTPDEYTTTFRTGPNGYDASKQQLTSALTGARSGQSLGQQLAALGDAASAIVLGIQAQDLENAARLARGQGA